jgi:SAM-dependent methyltransferase
MFKKYEDPKRKNGGSQSERSYYRINGNFFDMFGYHNYRYDKSSKNHIIYRNGKATNQLKLINSVEFLADSTLLDIGCANGIIGLSLLSKDFKKICLVDHDKEYITNINFLLEWDKENLNKVEALNTDFQSLHESYDYVLVLSLIHWLYSSTADYGCLYKIIEDLKKIINKALIIEWVDNNDPVFGVLHHTNFNPQIHKTPYNKKNFLEALKLNFKNVKFLGKSTNTRELYACYI